MDFAGDIYSALGVSGPLYLLIAAAVTVLLAFGLSFASLEAIRIYREYSGPRPPEEPAAATPAPAPAPGTAPAAIAPPAPAVAPQVPIDVVKPTLEESMKAITAKYGLESLTLASADGLVIASTGRAADEDAAVYSNLFQELYRNRPEPYFSVTGKDVQLLLVEAGGQQVIEVAHRPGPLTTEEAAGLRDDGRRIVEKFGGVKS